MNDVEYEWQNEWWVGGRADVNVSPKNVMYLRQRLQRKNPLMLLTHNHRRDGKDYEIFLRCKNFTFFWGFFLWFFFNLSLNIIFSQFYFFSFWFSFIDEKFSRHPQIQLIFFLLSTIFPSHVKDKKLLWNVRILSNVAHSSTLMLMMMTNSLNVCIFYMQWKVSFTIFQVDTRTIKREFFPCVPSSSALLHFVLLFNVSRFDLNQNVNKSYGGEILFHIYLLLFNLQTFKHCMLVHGSENHHKFSSILSSINLSIVIIFWKKVLLL